MKMNGRYGVDAPFAAAGFFVLALVFLLLLPLTFYIQSTVWFWIAFFYVLATALSFFIAGTWMVLSSLFLKPALISQLIDKLELSGTETVLDMGCGGGLFLIKAAKRLPSGKACGIDLWYTRDQSSNTIDNTLSNAENEGVKDRIELKTADMCAIPYDDNSFDCVVSSLAIHNIKDKERRHEALSEMLRVLKPGGRFVIMDMSPAKSYFQFLSSRHNATVKPLQANFRYCPPLYILKGKKNLQK